MTKKRISKPHNLTFHPEKWKEIEEEAKKLKLSVSKYLTLTHDKFKNT